jgi:transcriptional regulator with XRE-family HTH domain
MKKTDFMDWIDGEIQSDPRLARDVDALLDEMKLEQELVALREMRGLSQRDLARLLGASQPYVANLESGRVRNLGVRTLVKCARAGGIRDDQDRTSYPSGTSEGPSRTDAIGGGHSPADERSYAPSMS